jgi:hypothetical protein
MLRQVLQAIRPWLPLKRTLESWGEISADLAEPPRERKSQEQMFMGWEDS